MMEYAAVRFLLKHWLPILALVLLSLALGYAFHKGAQGERDKVALKAAAAEKKALQVALERAKASERVVTHYVDRVQVVRGRTQTIIKEVPVYVSADDPDLSAGWRVLHDAAAAGVLPDPAAVADAAPVSAQAAAETVASNYGTCHETAEQLTALQEWIREQQKIH